MAQDNLDVNPESVNNLAEPYQYAANDFENLSGRIDGIWSRYQNAWGHDSIGAQVAPSFEQGFEYLRTSAKSFHQTLSYYSDGLSQSGKTYGDSEDNATEGGRKLDLAFGAIETPTFNMPAETPYKTARRVEGERVEGELAPEESGKVFMRSERRLAEPLRSAEVTDTPMRPREHLAMRSSTPAERMRMPAIPEGAVIDPSIPPDDYGPWYRLPDGTILAHPARMAIAQEQPGLPLLPREYDQARPAMPVIPPGAVVDPTIPPDDYGPWYRLPDGTILAHPAMQARIAVEPTET